MVTLGLPVFANPGEQAKKYALALGIDVLPKERKLSIAPLADELAIALAAALGDIRKRIEQGVGEKIPVFFGKC